jgi:hypothetical protein
MADVEEIEVVVEHNECDPARRRRVPEDRR